MTDAKDDPIVAFTLRTPSSLLSRVDAYVSLRVARDPFNPPSRNAVIGALLDCALAAVESEARRRPVCAAGDETP